MIFSEGSLEVNRMALNFSWRPYTSNKAQVSPGHERALKTSCSAEGLLEGL